MPKKSSGLTPAQRSAFFRALQAASIELGHATPEEREDYRKTVMREETGKEHLAQLSRTKDFDACMRRFASDAGDFESCRHDRGGGLPRRDCGAGARPLRARRPRLFILDGLRPWKHPGAVPDPRHAPPSAPSRSPRRSHGSYLPWLRSVDSLSAPRERRPWHHLRRPRL